MAARNRHQPLLVVVELVEALAALAQPSGDRARSYRTARRGIAGCRISQTKNGIVVRMPSTWYSSSARDIRAIAVARDPPQATSLAIIES